MKRCARSVMVLLLAGVVSGCAGSAKPQATVAAPKRDAIHQPAREPEARIVAPAPQVAQEPKNEVTKAPPPATAFVAPFPGVRVRVNPPTVEVEAIRCLDVGWLEQVACMPGTREHEALLVVEAKPSHVHAAMLLAGFEPGEPGKWIYHSEEKRIEVLPPSGAKLNVMMRYEKDGKQIEEPVTRWIRDHLGEKDFPNEPWVFAGSLFEKNPEFMGPGEHYVADQTGSIIGLVTFGDEVIAFSKVIADQVDVQPAEWEVDDVHAPPMNTRVVIVITSWNGKD